ncbi:hypothetical protein ACET3X_006285 [Alternaria dauci]|uniref:Ankyrin n=1 Tax=Alternaria dauci TaxID=48095 RepID=A0ABR3UHV0_9PLEO
MTNLSNLPAETRREILIHAVNVRGLRRGLRLRLVNKEFSQEVKNALYQSYVLEDYQERWLYTKSDLQHEFDAFWQSYLTYKIMRRNWDNTDLDGRVYRATESLRPDMPPDARRRVFRQISQSERKSNGKLFEIDLYERTYRAAERLFQVNHPGEKSKEISHKVLKQYIYAFCRHPQRMLKSVRLKFRRYKTCPFSDPLHFLEMALVNDCEEGIKLALDDPAIDDVLSHDIERGSAPLCHHYIITTAAECGNLVLLGKIFSNPTFQQRHNELGRQVFEAAVEKGRLDAIRFIMDKRRHSSDFSTRYQSTEDAVRSGVLKSRSVNFYSQLSELLAFRLKKDNGLVKNERDTHLSRVRRNYLEHDHMLRIIALGSPQRADVAEWLLNHGASASLTADGEKTFMISTQSVFWPPLERAVKGGNEKIVRLLLDRGPNLSAFQTSCCYEEAAKQGRLDIVHILVEYGARVGWRPSTCRELHWRCTLMMHAVRTENEGLCRYLVEHGTCVSDGALNAAIDELLVSMVKLLLELGAVVTEHNIRRAKLLESPALFPDKGMVEFVNVRPARKFQFPYGTYGGRRLRMSSNADTSRSEVIALLEAHNNDN